MEYNLTGTKARWSVLWYSVKGHKIVEIEFEDDLPGALTLWHKVKSAGKPMATLRCCNVGFPPPTKYRPHYKTVITRSQGKRVKRSVWYEPMLELNVRGAWWCPYCMSLRKFKMQDGANMTDGRYISFKGMYCPVCQVNDRDHHVRKWNPHAQLIQYKIQQNRRKSVSTPRARSSRRRS